MSNEKKRFAILVTWVTGEKEIYARLAYFTTTHHGFNVHTIYSYLNRRKIPYIDERVTIEKIPFIRIPKEKANRNKTPA